MEKSSCGFLTCGGRICVPRYSFMVNAILITITSILPLSLIIRIRPDAFGFIDGGLIIFLLPVLTYFLCWGLGIGCQACLFPYSDVKSMETIGKKENRYGFPYIVDGG